jgi:hypothetical protein
MVRVIYLKILVKKTIDDFCNNLKAPPLAPGSRCKGNNSEGRFRQYIKYKNVIYQMAILIELSEENI